MKINILVEIKVFFKHSPIKEYKDLKDEGI